MRRVRIEMTGLRYGELLIISFSHLDEKKNAHWVARCSCGVEKSVNGYDVRAGKILSCGHLKKAAGGKHQLMHGQARRGIQTREYRTWRNMINRCYDPKNNHYQNYGGRGISVCAEWRHDFSTFFHDMGEKPLGLSIDRIDVHGNYEPSNCRWATNHEQAMNTTRSKRYQDVK